MSSTDPRPTEIPSEPVDVIVVGAGLAGLCAAAFVVRSGASVAVLDARREIGGWARTTTQGRFRFNHGPHALYRGGAGAAALRELGAWPTGRLPQAWRSFVSIDGRVSRTGGRSELAGIARVLRAARTDRFDPALVSMSAEEWLRDRSRTPAGYRLAAAVAHLTTYAARLDVMSADALAHQMYTSLKGVTYIDDGWAQLVGLLETHVGRGHAQILPGVKTTSVRTEGALVTVGTDAGELRGGSVILAAGGASTAAQLLEGRSAFLTDNAAGAEPIHAATLEMGMSSVPVRKRRGVLGADRASYAFFHTPSARLVDGDGDVAHVMAYEPDPDLTVEETDRLVDSIATEFQPGWESHIEEQRRGRRLLVSTDRPHIGAGLAGRPPVKVPDVDRTFIAGDWVGPDELLAGAALASGRAAGLAAAVLGGPATTAVSSGAVSHAR